MAPVKSIIVLKIIVLLVNAAPRRAALLVRRADWDQGQPEATGTDTGPVPVVTSPLVPSAEIPLVCSGMSCPQGAAPGGWSLIIYPES